MPLSKVGFNITGVNNLVVPDFNVTSNVTGLVNNIPVEANKYTNNLVGVGILITLFTYLYYKLSDVGNISEFRYSQLRSISLSCGISSIVGIIMFSIGYFRQFYPVTFFIVVFMITFIWVFKEERSN